MICFSFFPGSFSSSVPWDDDRFLFLFVLHQKCDLAAITIGKMVDLVSSSHETNMHFNLNAWLLIIKVKCPAITHADWQF